MPEDSPLQSQTPDALMLFGFWYRALPANEVRRGETTQAMLLEQPLVIGRDKQGQPFALRDACPHRGMPLSCGQFDGEQIECSYHGWRFDAHTGQCKLIPSLVPEQNLKIDRIYAGSYPCEERDDFIWVFIPDPGPAGAGFSKAAPAPTPAPEIPKFSEHYKLAYLTADLPVLRRPRHHRLDGSRARTLRSPGLVVAYTKIDSQEAQELRAHSLRISHERAHSQFE